MFKSTKDFDKAMHAILNNIQNGESDFFANLNIDETDAVDALERAIELGFINGLTLRRAAGNHVMFSKTNPRLSYDGLSFVEGFKG